MVGILTTALARVFSFVLTYPDHAETSRLQERSLAGLEERLTTLLRAADLTTDNGSTSAYFLAGVDATGEEGRVTFTISGRRVPSYAITSDATFEESHERFGPLGGLTEVSIGPVPVGDSGGATGLFLREQCPSDGDPLQGGLESLLSDGIEEIQFELFDGLTWQLTWDTRVGQRRLPSAVRVTYRLFEEDQLRSFVVRLPHSDITPENPLSTGDAT